MSADSGMDGSSEIERYQARMYRMADQQNAMALQINALEVKVSGLEEHMIRLATADQLEAAKTNMALQLNMLTTNLDLKLTHLVTQISSVKRPIYAVVMAILLALVAAGLSLVIISPKG